MTGWWTPFGFPGLGDVLFLNEDAINYKNTFNPDMVANQKSNEGAPSASYGKNDLKPKKEFLA